MTVTPQTPGAISELAARFADLELVVQPTADEIPTVWVPAERAREVIGHLKNEAAETYPMLYDLTAIDERTRRHREGQPESDFTVVYHLLSLEHNRDVRLKVALRGEMPTLPTITGVFPAAEWYERAVWDMFGVGFEGLPPRPRILMPPWWQGYPLRKESPSRATEIGHLTMSPERAEECASADASRDPLSSTGPGGTQCATSTGGRPPTPDGHDCRVTETASRRIEPPTDPAACSCLGRGPSPRATSDCIAGHRCRCSDIQ